MENINVLDKWHRSDAIIDDYERIHLVGLVFLLLTVKICMNLSTCSKQVRRKPCLFAEFAQSYSSVVVIFNFEYIH